MSTAITPARRSARRRRERAAGPRLLSSDHTHYITPKAARAARRPATAVGSESEPPPSWSSSSLCAASRSRADPLRPLRRPWGLSCVSRSDPLRGRAEGPTFRGSSRTIGGLPAGRADQAALDRGSSDGQRHSRQGSGRSSRVADGWVATPSTGWRRRAGAYRLDAEQLVEVGRRRRIPTPAAME